MIKSIGAIAAGYLIFGLSAFFLLRVSGVDPRATPALGFAVFSIAYGVVFGCVAGYVAATLAPRRPMRHAVFLAALIAAGALVSLSLEWGQASPWSQIATILLMAPATAAGGVLRLRGGLARRPAA